MQTITEENTIADGVAPPKASKKTYDGVTTIKSRFGDINVNKKSAISFKHGLLGIPSAISFCLTELPSADNDQFKLLQCMEDDELSFIVVPSQYDNQLIAKEDLDSACKVLDIKSDDLVVLFIVTVHEKDAERRISVNAKAPILVDSESKTATQFVIQNENYEIQHMIS